MLQEIVGGLISGVRGIIEEFHLPPEKAAELKLKMEQLEADSKAKAGELDAKLNQIASDNIKVETSSLDAFVRRSRPAFIWAMGLALAYNITVMPVFNALMHKGLTPMAIPAEYFDLFKIAFLGYVTARTVEKVKGTA